MNFPTTKKRIVVLGAGIVGRLAKIHIPHAIVLEAKKKTDLFTAELGVQITITPIPELECLKCTRHIQIDNQRPTLDLIEKYRKKIERSGDLGYGDFRQFESVQTVYRFLMPQKLDVYFGSKVKKICLEDRTLELEEKTLQYDYLISTIPLIHFIELTNMFTNFKNESKSFFMHRPIYVRRTKCPNEESVIRENYITDLENPIYRENWIQGIHNEESVFKFDDHAVKIYPGKIYNNSQVPHLLEDLKSFDVHCVGRYAQWDNRIHLWNVNAYLKLLKESLE